MKARLLVFLIFLNSYFNLFSNEVFEIEYDLNPYIYPPTGDWIYELTPRCLQITPDSGFAVLMEIELTDGMLAHFCTALLKTDSAGTVQWFKMLTNDPTLNDFYIMMQGWYFARGFTIADDGGFVIPITGDGYGEAIGSFILKLDANGEYEWHTQLSDETYPYIHYLNTIKQTSNGEFYAAGYRDYAYPNYLEIMEVVKLTSMGDTLWARTYQDSVIFKNAYDIEIDTDENPILVGHLKDLDMNYFSFTLKINNNGDIIWINTIDEHISSESSICRNLNNTYTSLGGILCNNERRLFIRIINNFGAEISYWEITYTYNQYIVIPSIVTDEFNNSFFTARLDNGLEITKLDDCNNILWQREIMGKLGNGPEILQKNENNFFITISVHNDDTLVITKMDEDGNSTDIYDDIIVIKEPHFNAYPNPFNPTTTINYSLKENSKVTLKIYNIKGQKVKTLVNEVLPAGEHSIIWDGRGSSDNRAGSGIYFYKLKTGDFQKVKKMILIK